MKNKIAQYWASCHDPDLLGKPKYYVRSLRAGCILSDEELKDFAEQDEDEIAHAILEEGVPFKGWELEFLHNTMPKDKQYKYDVRDSDVWRDDVLEGYMDHIYNHRYKYKPEAQQLDSSIDPQEEHVGPMAQEIEKVNPAAIIEDPSGYKKVDTGRLALMNAGAIAELARELAELKRGMKNG